MKHPSILLRGNQSKRYREDRSHDPREQARYFALGRFIGTPGALEAAGTSTIRRLGNLSRSTSQGIGALSGPRTPTTNNQAAPRMGLACSECLSS